MRSPSHSNVATLVLRHAEAKPSRIALVLPRGAGHADSSGEDVVSYGDLGRRVDSLRAGLDRIGLQPGQRILVLLPVTLDLFALTLAAAASGLVAVMIDGALGPRRLASCLRCSGASAIASVPRLLSLWPLLPPLWRMKRFSSEGAALGVAALQTLASDPGETPVVGRSEDDEALITFTTGSTGAPKGVDRTHGILLAQHRALARHIDLPQDGVDMPCFPVLALQNLCLGITTVMPRVDLRNVVTVEPSAIAGQAARWRVTSMAAAPAFMTRVAGAIEGAALSRIIVGGAPVPRRLCETLSRTFPRARLDVIYGSSEAEPISLCPMAEVLQGHGEGFLVGGPIPEIEAALAALPEPPPALDARGLDPYATGAGEVGEVIVRGSHVVRRYVSDPESTRALKLPDPAGGVWHRTGDLARQDGEGRLWLLGRLSDVVSHRGTKLYPLPIEADLDEVPGVRSALIAHPRAPEGEIAIAIDPGIDAEAARREVERRLAEHGLGTLKVAVVPRIPVDARHGSKVARAELHRMRCRRLARA